MQLIRAKMRKLLFLDHEWEPICLCRIIRLISKLAPSNCSITQCSNFILLLSTQLINLLLLKGSNLCIFHIFSLGILNLLACSISFLQKHTFNLLRLSLFVLFLLSKDLFCTQTNLF